jgi:hypothetical protein
MLTSSLIILLIHLEICKLQQTHNNNVHKGNYIYLDWKENIITIHNLFMQKNQNKNHSAKDMSNITQY